MGSIQDIIIKICIVFAIIGIIVAVYVIWLVNHTIAKPINILSKASRDYMADGYSKRCREKIENLQINSYAEIESMHTSLIKMGKDIDDYI